MSFIIVSFYRFIACGAESDRLVTLCTADISLMHLHLYVCVCVCVCTAVCVYRNC